MQDHPQQDDPQQDDAQDDLQDDDLQQDDAQDDDLQDNDLQDDAMVLSFDQLRAVFANLDQEGFSNRPEAEDFSNRPEAESERNLQPIEKTSGALPADLDQPPPAADDDEHCIISPRTIFEAMLFVGNRENKPLLASRAAELMRNVSPEELVDIVQELNTDYSRHQAPYHIVGNTAESNPKRPATPDDGYRLVLRPEFESLRFRSDKKVRATTLSQAAIDVLAIVAYKQPVGGDEVQRIRHLPSQAVLQQLVRRGLIEKQTIQRDQKTISLFRTTERFLRVFQLDSLEDLPVAEEVNFR